MSKTRLETTLAKVNDIITLVGTVGMEELEEALDDLSKVEVLFPVLDPTGYMGLPQGSIEKLKAKVIALINLKKYKC